MVAPLEEIKIPKKLLAIEGHTSKEELRNLIHLASQVPADQAIVEIGAFRGRSTISLAYGSSIGNYAPVYSVDPHLTWKGRMGQNYSPTDMGIKYINIVDSGYANNIYCVHLDSKSASYGFAGRHVGLIFIDGDHDAVTDDFSMWNHTFRPGTVVALHDYKYQGVRDAIEEYQDHMTEAGSVGALKWFMWT